MNATFDVTKVFFKRIYGIRDILSPCWNQICPVLNGNEVPIPYDKRHKVSSLVKSYRHTHNSARYEVSVKHYLRSIPDIGG